VSETLPKAVQVCDSVIFQKLQDEVVLLNMEEQNYFGLDDVGAKMWEQLAARKTIDEAVRELLRVYEIDETTLRQDLETFVLKLIDAGLVRPLVA